MLVLERCNKPVNAKKQTASNVKCGTGVRGISVSFVDLNSHSTFLWCQGLIVFGACGRVVRLFVGCIVRTGSDVIHIIASTGTCGVDAAVGGMSYTATGSPPALTFALGKLVSGTYKVCHCPSTDGADVDSTACSSADEFTNEAGQLDVEGVAWLHRTCQQLRKLRRCKLFR